MTDKLLSALSLSRRAGALVWGNEAVLAEAAAGRAALVLFASDISPGTAKRVSTRCAPVPTVHMPLAMGQLLPLTKQPTAVYAVCDIQLARLCRNCLPDGAKASYKEETE